MMTRNNLLNTPLTPLHIDNKRIHAFPWFGGKFRHLKWLLPLLPKTTHYVEPFGGSGTVLFNREPSYLETYNDLNSDVVNFFQVLREQPDDLIRLLRLTPWSRGEFARACTREDSLTSIEKARRFFVLITQGFMAKTNNPTIGYWSHHRLKSTPYTQIWQSKIDGLFDVAKRLLSVQIENYPATKVLAVYDTPETLFYCDPPYLMQSRPAGKGYLHELTLEKYKELAEILNNCKGKVAVSGYEHPIMHELYPSGKWYFTKNKPLSCHNSGTRTECLWTNYDPHAGGLFDFSSQS